MTETPQAPTGLTAPEEAVNLLTAGPPPVVVHDAQERGSGDAAQRAQELAAQLAEAQAQALAAGHQDTVMVKVEPPHSELHYGGVRLTSEFSPVPRSMLTALTTAAIDSRATITTQES